MKNTNITVNYFGSIAEITFCRQEVIVLKENQSMDKLHDVLLKKYKPLKTAIYKFTHNQTITENNPTLKDQDEIALLPPFAGG
jgi:molybdopterin synthase sulfur carrier subunit|tara:strand:- start:933 stop:1181 length:249 start_codon:yes stop_codon:yes gene_type:complete